MIYKRGKSYWHKFMWNGKLARELTLVALQSQILLLCLS